MRQHVAGLALLTLIAACGGADDEPIIAVDTVPAPTEPVASPTSTGTVDDPPPTAASTTTSSTTTSPTTTSPTTVPAVTDTSSTALVASTRLPMPCDGTAETLTTASGRSVTLRTGVITSAAPTIIALHGFTGTPSGIERVADLTELANAAGIAVAYPQGTAVSPGGFGWGTGAAVFAATGVDDTAAISEMIDTIVATGCVDRQSITITGESNGAGMTLAALCSPELAGAFRSAVMVIPAIDAGVLERCAGNGAPDTPLAVAVGLIDTTAPVEGGNGLLPQRAWFDVVAGWRDCSGVDERGALTSLVDHAVGANCRSCTEIFTVADGPHTWPGTRFGNGGSTPGTFDLNRRIVADVVAAAPGCLSER